jgi:hypothetical protein
VVSSSRDAKCGASAGIYKDSNALPNTKINASEMINPNSMTSELAIAWQRFQNLYPSIYSHGS